MWFLPRIPWLNLSLGLGLTLGLNLPAYVGQAADLETIQKRGHLIVAVKDNLRPLGFRNDVGTLVGLEIDLARRLAQDILGNPEAVVLKPVSNSERLLAVVDDQVDLAIAQLTATTPRARLVRFSSPYYLDGATLVTRDLQVRGLGDLTTATIAVLEGASTVAILRGILPMAQLVGVASYQAAYQLLEDPSDVVAFAADASVLSGWVQENPRYRLLPAFLSTQALCVAMPKGLQYGSLQRAVDGAIAQWQETGWLSQHVVKWGLPLGETQ